MVVVVAVSRNGSSKTVTAVARAVAVSVAVAVVVIAQYTFACLLNYLTGILLSVVAQGHAPGMLRNLLKKIGWFRPEKRTLL